MRLIQLCKRIITGKSANTASVAKERLQIIISHERSQRKNPEYLLAMQKEIIDVVAKYIKIDKNQVKIQLEHHGENAVLELNVTMPEEVLVISQ
jgi:cell division topological specificity factor